jgi:glycosyltransferase involved in cell wall biosynthesis
LVSNNNKPFLIYFIGPNFTVNSLAKESLQLLSRKYNVICVSEGPRIYSEYFTHKPINLRRQPSPIADLFSLFTIYKIVRLNKDSLLVTSTPKISFLVSICSVLLRRDYKYLHRGAVYQNFSGTKLKIYKIIDRFIIKNSTDTSFISESLFQYIKTSLNIDIQNKRFLNSSKGVDTELFSAKDNNQLKEPVTIGYLGRICNDKGYTDLLALINDDRLKDFNIIIKGKLEIKNTDHFIRQVKSRNIKYEEWDNHPEKFLKKIDILFFPSLREGFGNVAMEAAACGVPSVAYNIIGVKDAVKHGASGMLVDPNDSIIDKLYELALNKELLIRLKKTSRLYAEENFDQKKVLHDLHTSLNI